MGHQIAARFDQMPWQEINRGAREKVHQAGDRRLRLLALESSFVEAGWCTREHMGVVLEGQLAIETPEGTLTLEAGEGLWLPSDSAHRHKASVPPGKRALLFLVEPVDERPNE